MSDSYKPRFSFEISEQQQSRVNKLLFTHGIKKAVFSVILDDVLDMVEKRGQIVIGIILEQGVKPREIIPSMAKADVGGKDE